MIVIRQLSKTWLLIILIALIGGCKKGTVSKKDCGGVTCSSHGTCVVENSLAKCNCNTCYVADKLECVTDSSLCSGHGMCVEDNGVGTCQCDDGYHAEALYCIQDTPICLGGCTKDDDCYEGYITYYNRGLRCNNLRCVECSQDDQCIAHSSGWWVNPFGSCSTDGDCTLQKCIDVGGQGRCVSEATDCSKIGYGYTLVSKTDINGTDSVSVCAMTNTNCISGKCIAKECGSNTDCVAKYSNWPSLCSSSADCDQVLQACVFFAPNETIGYCAFIPNSSQGCGVPSLTPTSLPRFENRSSNVTVCIDTHALSDATCTSGICMNPCKNDSHCSNQLNTQTPFCDTNTGRCICKTDDDCKVVDNYDKCFTESGSCGCSSVSACTQTDLQNITWVCATK